MMFSGVHILIWSLAISVISQQRQPPLGPGSDDSRSGDSRSGDSGSSTGGSRLGPPLLCSEAGNCSCLSDDFGDTVKCTSVGNNFDEIAKKLPKTTTHL